MSFLLRNATQVLLSAEEIIKRFRDLVNMHMFPGLDTHSYVHRPYVTYHSDRYISYMVYMI